MDETGEMAVLSAGLLLHRRVGGALEVLIGHMGGPYWSRKQEGAWSIPKGEVGEGERPLDAARREFSEELGVGAPSPAEHVYRELGSVRQSGGKTVVVWAVEADLDVARVIPGTFEMEWPPRSGRVGTFPELDEVRWMPVATARPLLVAAQRDFIDRLESPVQV